MGTNIRPEISEKNKYWIDRHRYYELKHFCLQYHNWKKAYDNIEVYRNGLIDYERVSKTNLMAKPVEQCVEAQWFYYEKIKMVEKAAEDTDYALSYYILKAVTEGLSYDHLKARFNIPCCKDVYYELYRRFFWLLSEARK
ncbi:MAG: hypothetical protein NC215_00500 [Ruminococcus sp.]|nr:hypothetical protein [Ruminococcus sp.]MCM1391770.1 hypothetical protein [Ruminococcus sp.]